VNVKWLNLHSTRVASDLAQTVCPDPARRRVRWCATGGRTWAQLLVLTMFAVPAVADERPLASDMITSAHRQTFASIQSRLEETPDWPDRDTALWWVLTTAREWALEPEAAIVAEQAAALLPDDPAMRLLALEVQLISAARLGEADVAVSRLQQLVRELRMTQPNTIIDLATSAAAALQAKQDLAGAIAIYEVAAGGFFLNAEAKEAIERRRQRLELVGEPAPPIVPPDLQGRPFAWSQQEGRWTLLDFWATTCRPCIVELPRLRRLAREFQPRGLDVIGISLDDDAAAIEVFAQRQPLPWRVVLDGNQVTTAYQVPLIPCMILVDPQGKVAVADVPVSELRGIMQTLSVSGPKDQAP
jgi:peroxiredoxin